MIPKVVSGFRTDHAQKEGGEAPKGACQPLPRNINKRCRSSMSRGCAPNRGAPAFRRYAAALAGTPIPAQLQAMLPTCRRSRGENRRALPALSCPSPVTAPHASAVIPKGMMPKAAPERVASPRGGTALAPLPKVPSRRRPSMSEIFVERAEKADFKNKEYLPSHGFWARAHTEEDPIFETSTEVSSQQFLIDGTWDPPDISQFFARINDLYSFFLGIGKFQSTNTSNQQKRALIGAFTENTLHSGFNYVNFYGDLKGLVGFGERLAMPAIVKQSPGFVNVEGKTATLNEVAAALDNFELAQEAIKTEYNLLRGFLSRSKLLFLGWAAQRGSSGLPAAIRVPGPRTIFRMRRRQTLRSFTIDRAGRPGRRANIDRIDKNDPIYKFIRAHNETLANLLAVNVKPIDRLTGNALTTAKILLAHYRRLERYHMFFVEGRARASSTPPAIANSPSIEGIQGV